jgi:hypothetical protein
MKDQKPKRNFKQRLFHEFSEYMVNFIYMSVVFSAIILYRRLLLAEHGIILDDYFIGVFKAFVIAKVVMIGAFLKISRRFEHKPLFIPILYKAFIFTLMVMLFDVVEEFIRGFIHNPDFMAVVHEMQAHVSPVWLGASLLIFFIFIPFFGVKELIRVMGKENVKAILLERRKE